MLIPPRQRFFSSLNIYIYIVIIAKYYNTSTLQHETLLIPWLSSYSHSEKMASNSGVQFYYLTIKLELDFRTGLNKNV